MAKGLIAFATGFGTGYLNQQDKNRQQERQDKKDAQDQEEFDARKDERNEQKKEKTALADAGATVTGTSGFQVDGPNGKEFYSKQPDAEAAQGRYAADAQAFGEDAAALGKAPGAAPAPAIGITGRSVGNQITTEPVDVAAMNTPEARTKRTAEALYGLGKPVEAMQMEQSGKTAKLTDLQLKQAEETQARDGAFREITENFVKQGWGSVPKIYENYKDGNTAKVVENGKGGAVVSIFNGKGEQVGQRAFASEMEFITDAVAKVDPKLWVSMKAQDKKDAQLQSNADRDFELRKSADKRADNADKRAAGAESRAESRANENPILKKVTETEAVLGRKLSQSERERLAGMGKEDEKGDRAFADDIIKEAVKAGTVLPAAAPAARQDLLNQMGTGRQLEKVRSGLAKAKVDGKMEEAVADLRKKGLTDSAIISLGGVIELPAAAPVAKPANAAGGGATPPPVRGVVGPGVGVRGTAPATAPAVPATAKGTGSTLDYIAGLSKDYSTPEAKSALQQRVQQAANGGTPLTRIEILRAQQAGFTR